MSPIKTFSDLPLEVLQDTLDHLQKSHQLATLASFQQTSKYFHKLSTPFIYKELIINQFKLARLLLTVTSTPSAGPDAVTNASPTLESTEFTPLYYNLRHTVKIILIQSDRYNGGNDIVCEEEQDDADCDGIASSPLTNVKSVEFSIKRKTSPLIIAIAQWIARSSSLDNVCLRWTDDAPILPEETGKEEMRFLQDLILSFTFADHPVNFVLHHAASFFPWSHCTPRAIFRLSYHKPFDLDLGTLVDNIKQPLLAGAIANAVDVKDRLSSGRLIIREDKLEPETQKAAIAEMIDDVKDFMAKIRFYGNMHTQKYDIEASQKWIEEVEWVYGEEAEKEPPCQVGGSKCSFF
ncbi:hypothetical protein I302_101873 [Kwoniella bestiolae CBS 10118]|uniref:F-box domain-containing protein n=1 Tax=Kwoniella bestiolae CBS 10118 TaxID=1296100 RepID=A0A1B9GDG2_9TREE|nr:hypothetical protein I302_00552 [Kwoniella bestiolae CBS 10118]OCF29061.1 hypothetical protein I302_00552 [Kwoniella bestiolae CBS 10118]